jgi:hypothetical protein
MWYTCRMSASVSSMAPRWRPSQAGAAAPPVVSTLAVLLATLLLLQPFLCIVHCALVGAAAHPHTQHTRSASDPRALFLCDMPGAPADAGLFVPAFWPGVLPLVVAAVVFSRLLAVLTLPTVLSAPLRRITPPTPPPR